MKQRYQYTLLQTGSLPLAPDGKLNFSIEHRCTSVLLWLENQKPLSENTILTDPCFTSNGLKLAKQKLENCQLSFPDIRYIFITHRHGDHLPNPSFYKEDVEYVQNRQSSITGITMIPCIGHSPDLQSLAFYSNKGEFVWVVGDAILNLEWLMAWGYYWPNRYSSTDIIQTWKSVVTILSNADIVIPGHGEPINITVKLIRELSDRFPFAKHANKCPNLQPLLKKRLNELKGYK